MRRWLDDRLRARAARLWSGLSARAATLPRSEARSLRDEARALQRDLRAFIRTTSPRAQAAQDNLNALPLPAGTDWRWRPTIMTARIWRLGLAGPVSGARLGQEMRIWHDAGTDPAVILRQAPNHAATDLSPYGLYVEALNFSGSYLSLSFSLPAPALRHLTRNHILRLELHCAAECPQDATARLNIANGPNTDVIPAGIFVPVGTAAQTIVEFELSKTAINENRLENIWLDLIFSAPRMNAIDLRDMVVSRHPRVQL